MAKATPIRGLSARSKLGEAGPRIVSARLGDVERHEQGLPAEEPVHDMRVAVRRLRAALRLLELRELDAPVKRLQDALGAVRDLQLQVEWLRGRDDALASRRRTRLLRAERELARAVAHWHAKTLPALLDAARQEFRGSLSGGRVHKLLRKRVSRFEERLETALRNPSPAAMHAVRRSVKQLRYLLELAKPAFPRLAARMQADLLPLQRSLGELHDVDLRIGMLRRGALLREQKEDRDRLASLVAAELKRWSKQPRRI